MTETMTPYAETEESVGQLLPEDEILGKAVEIGFPVEAAVGIAIDSIRGRAGFGYRSVGNQYYSLMIVERAEMLVERDAEHHLLVSDSDRKALRDLIQSHYDFLEQEA